MSNEFVSKIEEIMPAEELLFEPTPGFGRWAKFFPEEAKAHPAKMYMTLLEFLVETFTKEGDVVLDPMAGTGSTGVVAALHGRNAVNVELEKKFWEWEEKARENVEKMSTLAPKGKIVNLLGDARNLTQLLSQADTVITSPPYANIDPTTFTSGSISGKEGNFKDTREKLVKQEGYSETPKNIGNLPLGNVDAVITSPPYSDTNLGGGDPEKRRERLIKAGHDPKDFLRGKAANAVLKDYNEVDAVITSPPYGDTKKGVVDAERMAERTDEVFREKGEMWNTWGKTWRTPGRIRGIESMSSGYSENEENIGNLPLGDIDAVITSPPYSGTVDSKIESGQSRGIRTRDLKGETKEGTQKIGVSSLASYSENPQNIGNLPYGVDAVITSPPYADGSKGPSRAPLWERLSHDPTSNRYGRKKHPTTGEGYGKDKENIGNLPLGNIDAVITSPPYVNGFKHNPQNAEKRVQKLKEVEKKAVENGQKWAVSSEDAIRRRYAQQDLGYGRSKENIGNLPLGEVDAVITSPPYSEGIGHDSGDNASEEYKERLEMQRKYTRQMTSEGNIAQLEHGDIDAIITSPPYSETLQQKSDPEGEMRNLQEKLKKGKLIGRESIRVAKKGKFNPHSMINLDRRYSENPENIGNLPHGNVDAVITSPPYESSLEGTSRHTKGGIASRDPALAQTGTYVTTLSKATKQGVPVGYSPNKDNIGNMKRETYLEAMMKVYSEMYRVLKPDGRAVVVVKPFIRGKKPVDLPWHTYLLLRACGFELEKLYKLRLKNQSFWRVLYYKKHPSVPRINHEWVIVVRKVTGP